MECNGYMGEGGRRARWQDDGPNALPIIHESLQKKMERPLGKAVILVSGCPWSASGWHGMARHGMLSHVHWKKLGGVSLYGKHEHDISVRLQAAAAAVPPLTSPQVWLFPPPYRPFPPFLPLLPPCCPLSGPPFSPPPFSFAFIFCFFFQLHPLLLSFQLVIQQAISRSIRLPDYVSIPYSLHPHTHPLQYPLHSHPTMVSPTVKLNNGKEVSGKATV